jgi:hypothetical protein
MFTEAKRVNTTTRSYCILLVLYAKHRIFSGSGNRPLAESICQYLGCELQDATVILDQDL